MSNWLTVNSSNPEIVSVSITDTYGGKNITIHVSPIMVDTIKWMQQYRSQLEREQQIRAQDPAAQELFLQYETYMNLTYNK